MALRNIVRRKIEALLVVVGSLLGTAIITAAFVVGDTFDASIRDFGRTDLGPIDETVDVSDVGQLDAVAGDLRGRLRRPRPTASSRSSAAMVATRAGDHAEPRVAPGRARLRRRPRVRRRRRATTGLADAGADARRRRGRHQPATWPTTSRRRR